MKRIMRGWAIIVFVALAMMQTSMAAKFGKVGLVTDMGKIDDKTFNEYAYKGMIQASKKYGFKTSFIETLQPTDYEKNIQQFISEGFDTVLTVGFMLGDATRKMAIKYPKVKFVIVDFAYFPPIKNVLGLVFSEKQSGFLAGALAGSMSRSRTVGIVAGKAIPPVVNFREGYEAGVKYVCKKCEVLGVYIDSFIDPARGKTAALSQMDEGADVIFGAGGITGSGAIRGAAQAGAWVIGVDQDEYMTTFKAGKTPGAHRILSSAMKRIDNAVSDALGMAVKGKFKGGTKLYDAANSGIGLAPFHKTEGAIPLAVKRKLKKIARDLKSGKLVP
ncbi:MAG: BMP family ABC transporter substrate-binding protein [Proteobacteria bacterium]|nr:BMP family ABC transporter substrate-binding protein [Pseudomonadota bacterium]